MASSNSSEPELSRKDADFEKREAEDCISRSLAIQRMKQTVKSFEEDIETLKKYGIHLTNGTFERKLINRCRATLRAMPSAHPKSDKPSGKWILADSDNSITCCHCNCMIWGSDICNGEPHYCPNCGAKMDSEDKE